MAKTAEIFLDKHLLLCNLLHVGLEIPRGHAKGSFQSNNGRFQITIVGLKWSLCRQTVKYHGIAASVMKLSEV